MFGFRIGTWLHRMPRINLLAADFRSEATSKPSISDSGTKSTGSYWPLSSRRLRFATGEQSGPGWAQTNRGASVWFQNSRLKFCQLRFDPSGRGGVPNMETILAWGKLKGIRSAMPQWSQPGRSQIHPNPLTFWDQKSPIPNSFPSLSGDICCQTLCTSRGAQRES